MRTQELKNIFHKIKNERRGGAPHESWVRQNRDILMMQVRNTVAADVSPSLGESVRRLFDIFMPVDAFATAMRGTGVFLLVLGTVFTGGLASAQVYRDAMPGTLSYTIKTVIEQAQLALAPNEAYRTQLHADFADRRIDEASRLAEQPTGKQQLAVQTLSAFDHEIAALQDGLANLTSSDPTGVVETAKLLERKMALYRIQLRKAGTLLPADSQVALAASRDAVDGVTIKAMAVIVEHHLAGDSDAPQTVVVNKFEDRLKQAEDRLATASEAPAVTQQTAKAKDAIAATKKLINAGQYEAALTKMAEVVQLTNEVETTESVDAKAAATTDIKADGKAGDGAKTETPSTAAPSTTKGEVPKEGAATPAADAPATTQSAPTKP